MMVTTTRNDNSPSKVELFYWNPPNQSINFGDYLSYVIVKRILAENNLLLDQETIEGKRLLAIGSILHYAKTGDVVWGTGINEKIDKRYYQFNALDVRMVRGPITRNFLIKMGINPPEVYGDPALLLPHLFPCKFKRNITRRYIFIPNLHDINVARNRKLKDIISPLWDWKVIVNEILKAELVLSSSLHGLVVAEAYGVPARYVRLTEYEPLLKYLDYSLGVGRREIEYTTSIDEALEMGGMDPIIYNHEKLIQSFPIDLWKKGV